MSGLEPTQGSRSGRPGQGGRARNEPVAIFAALGDGTRLELIHRLCDGTARSIAELTAGTDLTRQAVTKHLRVLERAGLVRSSRVGRESRFRYCPEPVERARSYLDGVSRQWQHALESLRAFVELGPD